MLEVLPADSFSLFGLAPAPTAAIILPLLGVGVNLASLLQNKYQNHEKHNAKESGAKSILILPDLRLRRLMWFPPLRPLCLNWTLLEPRLRLQSHMLFD